MVAPTPISTAKACTSTHSAARTFRLVKVRSDWRTRCVWIAAVARIIGIAARPADWCSSVAITWVQPARTPSSASRRMRSSAARRSISPSTTGTVQSITHALSPMNARMARNSAVDSTGLSSCSRSHCPASSSSTLPRLPSRVLSDITDVSRRLSIGGLVTWLNAWRK